MTKVLATYLAYHIPTQRLHARIDIELTGEDLLIYRARGFFAVMNRWNWLGSHWKYYVDPSAMSAVREVPKEEII